MKRRRSRGSRSSRSARKTYWGGAQFAGLNIEMFGAPGAIDVASAWAKWPSGGTDPKFTQIGGTGIDANFIVPSDETLVKTIIGANFTYRLQGMTQDHHPVAGAVGLIAWDSVDPVSIDAVVGNQVPHPVVNAQADWIIRLPFTFTVDNFSLGNIASEFIVSRAMRKLPPGTGLLWCIGCSSPIDEDGTFTFDWMLDARMLFKSGYYQA